MSIPAWRPLAVALFALTLAAPAQAVTTTSFVVSGAVTTPKAFDRAALDALPQATRDATYLAGGGLRSDTFTGPTFWSVLNDAGIATDPAVRNDILGFYAVATGSDGYRAAFSLGELSPRFGGVGEPQLVATGVNGGDLGPDGFARIAAVGDARGGRFVFNLDRIDVYDAAPLPPSGPGGTSDAFSIGGEVATPTTVDRDALDALPPVTRSVTYSSGGNSVTREFTGVSLWDLLLTAGPLTDPAIHNDILSKLVLVTGTDGYSVILALGELNPAFGDPDRLAMVAFADENGDLTGDGFARIVLPGDDAGGRFVSNLASMTVFSAPSSFTVIPLPAPAALLAASVLMLALAGGGAARRRKA